MTSCLSSVRTLWIGLSGLSPTDGGAGAGAVLRIDHVICCLGLAIVLVTLIWWLARSRRDPLVGAPPRPNTLRPEAVLLAVLVYFLVGWLFITGLGLDGQADETVPDSQVTRDADGEADSGPWPEHRPPSVGVSLADILAKLTVLVVCLLVASHSFGGGARRFLLGQYSPWRGLRLALVLTVVALALCDLTVQATMSIVSALQPDYVFEDHGTIQLLQQPGLPAALILALRIGAAVVAPVTEEVFFRGMVQTLLRSVLRSRWVVIVLASLLFALPHQPLHALPALFVLALLLGYAYERTGSLLPPMVIHALFNAKTLLWEALAH